MGEHEQQLTERVEQILGKNPERPDVSAGQAQWPRVLADIPIDAATKKLIADWRQEKKAIEARLDAVSMDEVVRARKALRSAGSRSLEDAAAVGEIESRREALQRAREERSAIKTLRGRRIEEVGRALIPTAQAIIQRCISELESLRAEERRLAFRFGLAAWTTPTSWAVRESLKDLARGIARG